MRTAARRHTVPRTIAVWLAVTGLGWAQNTVFRYADANNDLVADAGPIAGYTTLQAAVDAFPASPAQSEILQTENAAPKTYAERVTITGKATTSTIRLTIRKRAGDPATSVDPPNTNPSRGFSIVGVSFVRIEGFTLTGSAATAGNDAGVWVEDSTDATIMNCLVTANTGDFAIALYKSTGGGALGNHVVDSCTISGNSGNGIQIARQQGCTVQNCALNGNADGIQLFDSATGCTVTNCRIYGNSGEQVQVSSNGTDATASSTVASPFTLQDSAVSDDAASPAVWIQGRCHGAILRRNRLYSNLISVRYGDGTDFAANSGQVLQNTFYQTTTGTDACAVFFTNGTVNWTVKNNILYLSGADIRGIYLASNYAGTSNYNDIYAAGGAWAGDQDTGLPGLSLLAWQGTGRDLQSIGKDPRFVDVNGVDDILGGANGVDDDFHVLSTFGYFTLGGGPFFDQAADSPCIDAGDPSDGVGSETADNGGRINQGCYGGSATAARSGDPNFSNTWTGWSILHGDPTLYTSNAGWNDPNNWSRGAVPASTQNVLIPDRSAVDEDPVTGSTQAPPQPQLDVTTEVNGVYLSDTANVYAGASPVARLNLTNATAYTLTASGAAALATGQTDTVQVTGTGEIVLRTGTLATTTGSVRLDPSGLLTADSGTANGTINAPLSSAGTVSATLTGANINFQRNFTSTGTLSFVLGASLTFTGSEATQTVSHTGSGSYANLAVNKTSGTADFVVSFSTTGTLTVTSGTLRLGTTGVVATLGSTASVGAGGTLLMEGTTTLKFNQAAPSATTPQLSVAGTFSTTGTTGSFPILTRDVDAANAVTVSISGTTDLNGVTLRRLGSIPGPPAVEGLQIESAATVLNVNDISVETSAFGVNYLRTTGVFTMRGCSFDASPAYNVKAPTGVPGGSDLSITLENASGAKGDAPAGEANDVDPYDATIDPPDGRVVWAYFGWRWVGGNGTNLWNETSQANDLANWLWQGSGPRPSDYPDGATESVWVSSLANPCTMNGSFSVQDLSVTTGAALNEGGGGSFTLTIYGTAFKSSGGTFDAGDGTVTFAGATTQTVIIIGGSGAFWRLTIAKSAGTAAELGTNLTVNDDLAVTGGDFDLKNYRLTVKKGTTTSAGTTLKVAGTSRLVLENGATARTAAISGTLEVSGGGIVDLGDGGGAAGAALTFGGGAGERRLKIFGSGKLRMWDSAESVTFDSGATLDASGGATITRQSGSPGGFGFTVNSGATVRVSALAFSYAGTNGFGLTPSSPGGGPGGATVEGFDNVAFANAASGGRHMTIGGQYTATLTNVGFDATFGAGSNVSTNATAGTVSFSQWSGPGAGEGFDGDPGEPGGNRIEWLRTLTWVGKWRRYRVIPLTGSANQYVFLRITGATTPTVGTLGAEGLNEANELRVACKNTSGGAWQELARNVATFNIAGNLVEVSFKLPASFSTAGGGEVRMYYDAASPGNAPALSDAESPKSTLADTFETNQGWTVGAAPATGQWERGAPTGENSFAPSADSGDTGTFALVTGLAATLDGTATLTSPALPMSGYYSPRLTFQRWVFFGGNGDSGSLTAAADGTTFSTTIETYANGTDVRAWTTVAWTPPSTFENVAGPKVRFTATEAGQGTFCEAGLDGFTWTAYRGDVVLLSGTVLNGMIDTTIGAAGVRGKWTEPFHWSDGGVPANLGPPTPVDDAIVNGNGGYPPELDASQTVASLGLGSSAASTLHLGGAGNFNLSTSAALVLGTFSTLDATGRTAGSISVGGDLRIDGGTWTMPASAPTSPFLAIGRDLLATGSIAWSGSTAVDVTLTRDLNVTGALRFPGILRCVGTGAGSPSSTIYSVATAAFRRVEVNRILGAGSGYTVALSSGAWWVAEMFNIDGGVLVAPSGTTLEAKDQADATFDTTATAGLEWVRFSSGGSSVANRVVRLTGGTVRASRVGSATPSTDAANNNNGRLDLQASGGTIETTGFLFKNNTDAANPSDVILAGGTVRVAGDWEISTSSGTAPSFLATGGTVVFHGTGAQSVIHSPSGGTPALFNVQVGEGTNGPNTLSLANDITCIDLDVVEGVFAPGANRTVTKTAASTTEVQSGGTLRLAGGAILRLAGGSTLDVNAGGTLSTTGTSASSRARIQNTGAGTIAFDVSGTMSVDYVTIANLAATGVAVDSTAVLTGWTGVRFTSGAAGGLYLDLSGATLSTTLPATISLCQFDAGPANNVKGAGVTATHANVTFSNWAGAIGGEPFETNDDLDLIDWAAGAAVVLRTNDPAVADVATFATLQDAILAADATNNVIEVRDNVIRDEVLNLSALGFRIVIDGAVLRPPGASTAIVGSGNPALEVLRNVVLIRDAASATPLLQDVANVIHCDVLGPFTTANPLITVTGPATCLIENSIVGDPASWQADGDDPITKVGALTVNHSFVDRGVVHPGANNSLASPQLTNWDPITGGSGLYDVHLKPGSPCIDYAPAPSIAVATDFDRGLDFNSLDQAPGGSNPRRPINARPDAGDGGGPYASWDDDFGTYDVGADELGPLVVGTGNKAQGVPLWTNRAGAGVVADPDSFSNPITSFTFSPAVMFVAENNNVAQAGHDVRLVAYSMNDADSDGDLDLIESLDLTMAAPTIQKVHSITVLGAGAQDNLYLVVDRDADADTNSDAVLALRYNPTLSPKLAVRGDWTANPAVPAGSGAVGRIVIGQSDGRLYFPRGDGRLYRRNATDGTAPAAAGNWLGDGRLDLSGFGYDGKIDAEGSLFAGKFNNGLYVPTNQHANEIIRVQLTDGSVPFAKSCGTGNRNHIGFNVISQSVFVTGADQYVWRIHEDTLAFNAWPAAVWPWESEPMGATVKTTTRAQMFRTVDANVRVGAGSSIYKLRKDTGAMTDDSDGAGDDWGPGRTFRGNILTAPTLVGGTGKDYTPVADGRRCGKLVFGTDQGYCYVASYIRATLTSDAEENGDVVNESQPASASIVGYDIRDGRPYPGFPYRIPGVKIVNLSLLTSSTVGRQVIVFITDNGWAYGFIEPY